MITLSSLAALAIFLWVIRRMARPLREDPEAVIEDPVSETRLGQLQERGR